MAKEAVEQWVISFITQTYAKEIEKLTKRDMGFHFLANHTTYEQVTEININKLVEKMWDHAPTLWRLFGVLLAADDRLIYKCKWACTAPQKAAETPKARLKMQHLDDFSEKCQRQGGRCDIEQDAV